MADTWANRDKSSDQQDQALPKSPNIAHWLSLAIYLTFGFLQTGVVQSEFTKGLSESYASVASVIPSFHWKFSGLQERGYVDVALSYSLFHMLIMTTSIMHVVLSVTAGSIEKMSKSIERKKGRESGFLGLTLFIISGLMFMFHSIDWKKDRTDDLSYYYDSLWYLIYEWGIFFLFLISIEMVMAWFLYERRKKRNG